MNLVRRILSVPLPNISIHWLLPYYLSINSYLSMLHLGQSSISLPSTSSGPCSPEALVSFCRYLLRLAILENMLIISYTLLLPLFLHWRTLSFEEIKQLAYVVELHRYRSTSQTTRSGSKVNFFFIKLVLGVKRNHKLISKLAESIYYKKFRRLSIQDRQKDL